MDPKEQYCHDVALLTACLREDADHCLDPRARPALSLLLGAVSAHLATTFTQADWPADLVDVPAARTACKRALARRGYIG